MATSSSIYHTASSITWKQMKSVVRIVDKPCTYRPDGYMHSSGYLSNAEGFVRSRITSTPRITIYIRQYDVIVEWIIKWWIDCGGYCYGRSRKHRPIYYLIKYINCNSNRPFNYSYLSITFDDKQQHLTHVLRLITTHQCCDRCLINKRKPDP